MASLSEIYLKKSTLETILKALNAKQGKEGEGVKITTIYLFKYFLGRVLK